jgi:hypothetical protein
VGGGISRIAASIFGGGDDDDAHGYGSDHGHHHRHSSSSKRRSSGHHHKDDDGTRSFFGLGNGSKSSFFSGFGTSLSLSPNPPTNASTLSMHGKLTDPGCTYNTGGRHSPSGSSYYKRSPRPGFVARVLKKLKRLLRDLLYYAKRHPVKVFMLVLMPLITGGALTALLARFGLRLPKYLERMLGLAAKAGTGDSIGLVGEAVKMVSGGAGGAARVARASVERGRDAGVQW